MLMEAVRLPTCEEREKCVLLILDEMHVRENLVYNKHSGSLVGFANLGDVNNHLLTFERAVTKGSVPDEDPLAKTMMEFMVRGLFSLYSLHTFSSRVPHSLEISYLNHSGKQSAELKGSP